MFANGYKPASRFLAIIKDQGQADGTAVRFGLCFDSAYQIAKEGGSVLFICRKSAVEQSFPLPVRILSNALGESERNSSWSPAMLSQIKMKYVMNATDLKRVVASAQMMEPPPDCIVIDDFATLIDPSGLVSRSDNLFVGTCVTAMAHIIDAIDFLDRRKLVCNRSGDDTGASREVASAGHNLNGGNPAICGGNNSKVKLTISCSSSHIGTSVNTSYVNALMRFFDGAFYLLPISELNVARGPQGASYAASSTPSCGRSFATGGKSGTTNEGSSAAMDRDNNDLRNEYSRHDTSILNDSEASGAGTTYRMTARLKLKATLEWGRETLVYEHVFVDKNNAVIRCV